MGKVAAILFLITDITPYACAPMASPSRGGGFVVKQASVTYPEVNTSKIHVIFYPPNYVHDICPRTEVKFQSQIFGTITGLIVKRP